MRITASSLPMSSRYSEVSRMDRGYPGRSLISLKGSIFRLLPDTMKPFAPGFSLMADINVADTCLVDIKLTFPS